LGGVDDINNKLIRSCSNPDWMFHDDPLRIMRAVRFAARLGFDIEVNTLNSLKNNIHKLKFISRERIRDEFLKILVIKNGAGVKLLKDTGILGFLMPEFDKMDGVNSNKNIWNHTLSVLNHSKNTTNHKMAALFHDLGKVYSANTVDGKVNFHGHQFESEKLVVKFMKTFRFTNKEIDLISLAVRLHMDIDQVITVKTVRRLINTHGKDSMLFVLDLCIADVDRRKSNRDRVSFLRDLRSGIESDRFLKKTVEPLFAGKALMEMFNLKPSKKIGQLIEFQIDMLLGDPDITADEMILMLKTQL
jgi:tRNA nucleotidyltransferase/poly(A) polymerase